MFFVIECALLQVKLIHTRVLCIRSLYSSPDNIVIFINGISIKEILFNIIQSYHHHPSQDEGHTGGKPYHRTTGRLMIESFEGKQGFLTLRFSFSSFPSNISYFHFL